mgnify:CR=1 FL=1
MRFKKILTAMMFSIICGVTMYLMRFVHPYVIQIVGGIDVLWARVVYVAALFFVGTVMSSVMLWRNKPSVSTTYSILLSSIAGCGVGILYTALVEIVILAFRY